MKKPFRTITGSATRMSLALIVTAALLIELTVGVQYTFSRESITEQLQARANLELDAVNQKIGAKLAEVTTIVQSTRCIVQNNLNRPDSLAVMLKDLLATSPTIVNLAVAFEPDYYRQYGRWFEPVAVRLADGTIETRQCGTAEHDYFKSLFYTEAIHSDNDFWSEPYLNEIGQQVMVVSNSQAVYDRHGKEVAVVVADISLEWLNEFAQRTPVFGGAKITMLSRKGHLLVYPYDESKVMHRRVTEYNDGRSESANKMLYLMMAGKRGQMDIVTLKGDTWQAFFAPVDGETGWSIAITGDKREIYAPLKKTLLYITLLMVAGILLMGFIVLQSARSLQRLRSANEQQQRMAGELHVAGTLQQDMLPKTFPPFPDRNDIDIFGMLVPAKEVGGDLFDFFIRDEKLHFCVGDVSGKGVPSSLMMVVARSLFRTMTLRDSNPARILDMMNRSLIESNRQTLFVTLFLGVLDLPTGRLRYCNAGHDAPLIIHNNTIDALPVKANLPLGVIDGYRYQGQDMQLDPQAILFLFTDGLTEAMDAEHNLFRISRVRQTLQHAIDNGCTQAEDFIHIMQQAVKQFVGDAEQSDDLTMLALRHCPHVANVKVHRQITIDNSLQEVTRLNEFTATMANDIHLAPAVAMQLKLAIEEAVVNVINYGYPRGTDGEITIEAQADDQVVKFIITDNGSPFDPTTHETADTHLSADERPIGGLGILLVRQFMDTINYERINGQNVLTLQKKLTNL